MEHVAILRSGWTRSSRVIRTMVIQQLLAVIALLGFACGGTNQLGRHAATQHGDLSRRAERGSPIAGLVEACGDGALTAAGRVIRREPYLQQVTATSAMIGWVTTAPYGERVDLTMPDGTPVTTAAATVQHSEQRRSGEKQMWARLTGLRPDTVYCYRLANGSPLMARTGFRTAPDATAGRPVRFLALGDSGGGNGDQHALRERMLDVPYELIVHMGDIAYERGTIAQFEERVFAVYKDIFRNIPLFPVAGNHEYKTAGGQPFRDVFALPNNERWYSFDWGHVHFIALDTQADASAQLAWLERDLAHTRQPWKIVYLHKPPYSSGEHGSNLAWRRRLAPVLERHGVQLVFAGHDHIYERTTPQNGVVYVVTGGGGRGTYDVGQSSFTAFALGVIHYVYAEVGRDELVLHAIDAKGKQFDSLVIPRSRARAGGSQPGVLAGTR